MVSTKFIFEILIIGAAFLYIYRLFHGTRAARVLTGLILLLGSLILVTRLFELKLLAAVLQASSAFIVIFILIVFQPEIRRILAELGGTVYSAHDIERSFLIEHVIQSLDYLRERHYGALIAIERTMTHPQTAQSGVLIDAVVSEELLSSLFYDKNPLHDGGVIISGGRILAAGCVFPVSQRQDLKRTLGLRHRAALGFSEESDVLVVVLSEESGEISLCVNSAIQRPLAIDVLRQRLTDELAGTYDKAKRQGRYWPSLLRKIFRG